MVHRREINGEEVVFGNQGALWGSARTWWDHDTGSVWSQPLGEAIMGPLTGTRLELIPSQLLPWSEWIEEHPDTLALNAPALPDAFSLDQMAIVVELGHDSAAYVVDDLRIFPVVNSEVAGLPIAVVLVPGTDKWAVFSRQLEARVVELEWDDGALAAVDGDSRYDPLRGLTLSGLGDDLGRLPAFTSFPRDYVTFFPDGAFWTPGGLVPATER
jgi:hypothetical protein